METKKVILAEDYDDIRNLYQMFLETMGFHVIAVKDGLSVLQYLTSEESLPACVLTDYNLPDINGDTIVETIRTDKRTALIPVIVMSANHDHQSKVNQVGANAFLPKPFSQEQLYKCILNITKPSHSALHLARDTAR